MLGMKKWGTRRADRAQTTLGERQIRRVRFWSEDRG
jgi:hypothetical protein